MAAVLLPSLSPLLPSLTFGRPASSAGSDRAVRQPVRHHAAVAEDAEEVAGRRLPRAGRRERGGRHGGVLQVRALLSPSPRGIVGSLLRGGGRERDILITSGSLDPPTSAYSPSEVSARPTSHRM